MDSVLKRWIFSFWSSVFLFGLPWRLSGEESWNARDAVLIPRFGISLGGGYGNPLQYSCLGNFMGREAWLAIVHRVTKELDMTKQQQIFLFSYQVASSADSGKGREGYERLVELICWNTWRTKNTWHIEIPTILCWRNEWKERERKLLPWRAEELAYKGYITGLRNKPHIQFSPVHSFRFLLLMTGFGIGKHPSSRPMKCKRDSSKSNVSLLLRKNQHWFKMVLFCL